MNTRPVDPIEEAFDSQMRFLLDRQEHLEDERARRTQALIDDWSLTVYPAEDEVGEAEPVSASQSKPSGVA